MFCSAVFTGSALVSELQTSDKMTVAAARAWIIQKTGSGFAPDALYQLRWSSEEDSPTWSGYVEMHVHVMSDSELLELDREHRRQQRLPPRKPWETPLSGPNKGRAEPRRDGGSGRSG
jgi:hypothetical protein